LSLDKNNWDVISYYYYNAIVSNKKFIPIFRVSKSLMIHFFEEYIPTENLFYFRMANIDKFLEKSNFFIFKPGNGSRTVGIFVIHYLCLKHILSGDFQDYEDKFEYLKKIFEKCEHGVLLDKLQEKHKEFINSSLNSRNYIVQPYIPIEQIKDEIRIYANFKGDVFSYYVSRGINYLEYRENVNSEIKKLEDKNLLSMLEGIVNKFNEKIKIFNTYPVFSLDILILRNGKLIPIDYGIEFNYINLIRDDTGIYKEFKEFVNESFLAYLK